MHSILLMSIGPVQEFIASGRRCQDLWFGSELLCVVSCAAAEALAVLDATLVFPSALADRIAERKDRDVANKILARVPTAKVNALAQAADTAVRETLERLRDELFERIGEEGMQYVNRAVASAQIAELLEVLWVAVPEGNSYDAARSRAEALLNARKSTRAWGQPGWHEARGETGARKSSFDGTRESVLDERVFKRSSDERYRWFRTHSTERLSGVDLLKRRGRVDEQESFFSTSHVASLPFAAGATGPAVKEAWHDYVATLKARLGPGVRRVLEVRGAKHPIFGRADGALFFEGRLETIAEECGVEDSDRKGAVGECQKKLGSVLAAVAKSRANPAPKEPIPYYALLLGDGDRMGKAIDHARGFERHQRLSSALTRFSGEVYQTVQKHGGSLVYSGGDDVLAFLPLHRAVECADALRLRFRAELESFGTGEGEATPTLSVGIAVCHHLVPMDGALELVRAAEKRAKKSRNALAITVAKRSGAPVEIEGSWDPEGNSPPMHARLAELVRMHRRDLVPDRAAFQLEALGRLYDGESPPAELEPVLEVEALRILSRKQPGGADKLDGSIRATLEAAGRKDPVRLARELIVARLFGDAKDQAGEETGQ